MKERLEAAKIEGVKMQSQATARGGIKLPCGMSGFLSDQNFNTLSERLAFTEAAMMGEASTMDALLAGGADPKQVENSGMTPLMHAARSGHETGMGGMR